jgi:hypothetical protein
LDAIFRTDHEELRRSFDSLITNPREIDDADPGQLGPALEGVSRVLLGDFTTLPEETRVAIEKKPRSNMSRSDYHAAATAVIRSLPVWIAHVGEFDQLRSDDEQTTA